MLPKKLLSLQNHKKRLLDSWHMFVAVSIASANAMTWIGETSLGANVYKE